MLHTPSCPPLSSSKNAIWDELTLATNLGYNLCSNTTNVRSLVGSHGDLTSHKESLVQMIHVLNASTRELSCLLVGETSHWERFWLFGTHLGFKGSNKLSNRSSIQSDILQCQRFNRFMQNDHNQ